MSVKDTEYSIDALLDDLRDESLVNSCESVDLHTTDGTAERRPSPYNSRSRCQAGHTWSLQSDNQLRIFEESKLGPSMFYEGSPSSTVQAYRKMYDYAAAFDFCHDPLTEYR